MAVMTISFGPPVVYVVCGVGVVTSCQGIERKNRKYR